ncbi:hypothetical protein DNTS_008221 [Danionella cerebrum]|uniref:Alpha-carbonic anhydrase domain-containing protein n=1 Tax=Danionella cerebrum TaxID=2873325 RepID=A0A553R5N5_9TELE|nr:hypothetical protein DNTS_008221 [Danionella translucida]
MYFWFSLKQMQIFMYNSDDFDSLNTALQEKRVIAAMAVFFQVGAKDNPAVDPVIHGLRGVVHHDDDDDDDDEVHIWMRAQGFE